MPNKSDDILDDFFSSVDKEVKRQERKKRKKNPQNKLKRYKRPNDDPIRKLPSKPLEIVIYWTITECTCGMTYQSPTYPTTSAFVHWPNKTKPGVVDVLPLHSYAHYNSSIPKREVWTHRQISHCPHCYTRALEHVEHYEPSNTRCNEEEITIKPEAPSSDIRDYLDDPNTIILEDTINEGRI